jgi:cobalt-precorrin-5B (C1)-methyltransferase
MKVLRGKLPEYLQANGLVLRSGITTGTCAAAAARAAAALLFGGETRDAVEVETPSGIVLEMPLCSAEKSGGWARCAVRKTAGDDPDITDGVTVVAEALLCPVEGVFLEGGPGVGRATLPGLALLPGEAAINPVPRQQIIKSVQGVLPAGSGVRIIISVPGGEELARRTLNPALGITGGISILGTTGIVEPMSAEAFKQSLLPQIDVAQAAGQRRLVLTPGKMGKRNAMAALPVAAEAVVVISNFVGFMLQACAARGVPEAILFGHVGKLVKVAAGITNTHSGIADARRETLVAHAALCGLPAECLQELMAHETAEESAAYLAAKGYGRVLAAVAEEAARRAAAMAGGKVRIGCIMVNLKGEVVGSDPWAAGLLKEWKNG